MRFSSRWALFLIVAAAAVPAQMETLMLPDDMDSRSTAVRLQSRMDQLRVERLLQAGIGQSEEAAKIARRLDLLQGWLAGAALPSSNEAEVHVYSHYQPQGAGSGSSSSILVDVSRVGVPIRLVLSAYRSTTWVIQARPGVQIAEVLVSGYQPQTVATSPPGVPLTLLDNTTGGTYWGSHDDIDDRYSANRRATSRFGASVRTFQSVYAASSKRVVVGPESAGFREQWVLREAERAVGELGSILRANLEGLMTLLPFYPVLPVAGAPGQPGSEIVSATPLGRSGASLIPIQGSTYSLGTGPTVYFLNGSTPWMLDPGTGGATPMPLDPLTVSFSHPRGFAYDLVNDRALLVTLGGIGWLYAYTPATGTWAILANMNNFDAVAMVWSPANRHLYALEHSSWSSSSSLRELDDAGNVVATHALPLRAWGQPSWGTHQMFAAEHYVILLGPAHRSYPVRHCQVFDTLTDTVIYAGPFQG